MPVFCIGYSTKCRCFIEAITDSDAVKAFEDGDDALYDDETLESEITGVEEIE